VRGTAAIDDIIRATSPAKQYVYLWVDDIHMQARLEDEA
jgi:hypothetical protein